MNLNDYQTFYVYLHQHPKTNEVVYVGIGTKARAWAVNVSGSRSKEHNAWMEELLEEGYLPTDWVRIVIKGRTKNVALKIESEEIDKYRPKFNKCKNKDYLDSKKDPELQEIMKCFREMKYSYKNIAYLTGVSTMKTWRYLNG